MNLKIITLKFNKREKNEVKSLTFGETKVKSKTDMF